MRFDRAFGVLLHPTSLPGKFGIGDLGPAAHRYLEWLASAGAAWWQVLPLTPPGPGSSPYSGTSAFAGNVHLVSPEGLVEDGLLEPAELQRAPHFTAGTVEFERAVPFKEALLSRAWERFRSGAGGLAEPFGRFCAEHAVWLEDFALHAAISRAHGGRPWHLWPAPLASHDAGALAAWRDQHDDGVRTFKFRQFLFFRQWDRLRQRARALGVRVMGDAPIFVAYDSAEVWAHREVFRLDPGGRPTVVAGVPPDYFSEDGQLWGNPLYDWRALAATGYRWWVERLRANFRLFDALRLDHFRGFAAAWEVDAEAETARDGRWVEGPGAALFAAVRSELGDVALVAEDLGLITEDVVALRAALSLPGMAVLQFGFDPRERSTFLPYRHDRNLVVYTGTHDNNTTVGWWRDEASDEVRDFLRRYAASDGSEPNWDLIRLAFASVADLAIVPHQDVVGLDGDARMNIPGVAAGNWRFRLDDEMLAADAAARLRELAWIYGRIP